MKTKHLLAGVLGVIAFMPALCSAVAQPVQFFFTGQITETRQLHSVFAGSVGDSFSGYFSYDLSAPNLQPGAPTGFYPLLNFSVDGHELNFATGPNIPFLPGVFVSAGIVPGFPDMLEIRGFYLPAVGDFNDNGSSSVVFNDFSGTALNSTGLPTTLSLSSFTDVRFVGPIFVSSPAPPSDDRGIITGLVLVPEPAISSLAGLGLLAGLGVRRRFRPGEK